MQTESESSRPFRDKKDPHEQEQREEDIRLSLIGYAIRAPSHRNSQPWKVALRGTGRIVLSIDHSRVARALDPSGRQAFLSCGTFLENLDIAARASGYRADIDLFPAGWPDPGKPLHDPVASIDLERDERVQPDPLFHAIPIRQTNRRPYSGKAVPLSVAGELAAAGDGELVPFGFTNDRNLIREIRDLVTEALARELSDRERFREYCEYFRFTDAEAARHRDGYGLAQSGQGKIIRFFTGAFLFSRESVLRNPEAFSRRAVSDLGKILEKCGGIGWLSTKGDFYIDQVRAGRAFERIHLKACSLSLALQPVASPLAGYREMEEVRARLSELLAIPGTHTIQLLFRTGYAKRVPQTPRRDISDFIVS
ncbi:MAG: hypothetical protein QHH04_06375 [Methanolinea sp.]|nr:hypothetical protein [Methanolinea sp.]